MSNTTIEPDTLYVINRSGDVNPFDPDRIRQAVLKAYQDPRVVGVSALESNYVNKQSSDVANDVTKEIYESFSDSHIHVEYIQDKVELALNRRHEFLVAKYYQLYREQRRLAREDIVKPPRSKNGTIDEISEMLTALASDLKCLDLPELAVEARSSFYDGMTDKDRIESLLMTVKTKIEFEPEYSLLGARILLRNIENAVNDKLQVKAYTKGSFSSYLKMGIDVKRLDPKLLELFDVAALENTIAKERDLKFDLLGIQTLMDRYLLRVDNDLIELPQHFFMRVAMGLSLNEKDATTKAIEFYHTLSTFDFMCSTPTLFNSGTVKPQLSSCYLTSIPDDLDGIFEAMKDNANLSKWAGGLGNDWTPVRSLNSYIQGTNGQSQGVVPFMKVCNDTAVAVNQGGKRKGAICAYLETWHLDIEEFLELRKNTGDERRRTHDMHTANWIPDLFMKRVINDEQWTLFSPNETTDLHDLYGVKFEERYQYYENKALKGELKLHKTVSAKELWRKMLTMLFETGHPWLTFKDACNLRSPQQHCGVIHSSNLCTEITLNTDAESEIAVCNLGSINLVAHLDEGNNLNWDKLKASISNAIRMLDNVIDINYYAVDKARYSNLKHRPIGLGLMGLQDIFHKMRIPMDSEEAVIFSDKLMENFSYFAIEASAALASERGAYESFSGSLWSQGFLPIDSIKTLINERGPDFTDIDESCSLDWSAIRKAAAKGMRNSTVLAIAPTATIANIVGVSQSIEPTYRNLFVKSNLSGEFTCVNKYLVNDLKALGVWDSVCIPSAPVGQFILIA